MPHAGVGPDDFFYEGRFPPNSKAQRQHIERLRNICAECLVFSDCRAFVNEIRDYEGFYAGETADERRTRWHRETLVVIAAKPATLRGPAKP